MNDSGGSGVSRLCVQTWADLLAGPRAPPALQRVSFTFSIPNAIEDDVLDYLTLLDHPLCNIPTLQKCEFAIYYLAPNYAMSVLRGRVQRALPVCHAKGLVEVVYMPVCDSTWSDYGDLTRSPLVGRDALDLERNTSRSRHSLTMLRK